MKEFFHSQGTFPQSRNFPTVKELFYSQDKKGSLKAKTLDPFNTKSYAKMFLTL